MLETVKWDENRLKRTENSTETNSINSLLVMKFGGASVEAPESFQKIAKIIIEKSFSHKKIVVVVSAMGKTTDELIELAKKVHPEPPKREMDMLITVGERISIALLAMALSYMGVEAVSFTGSQSGIITCDNHSDAKIVDVFPKRIEAALEKGQIAIVAGFQGVSRKKEITTLGRGGSDTSAVALAVALGAERVEFYKDVAGMFDADPKKEAKAKLLSVLGYPEALKIAKAGAKVLHSRCIELAEKNGVQLAIHSFQSPSQVGTLIGSVHRNSELSYEVETCSHI